MSAGKVFCAALVIALFIMFARVAFGRDIDNQEKVDAFWAEIWSDIEGPITPKDQQYIADQVADKFQLKPEKRSRLDSAAASEATRKELYEYQQSVIQGYYVDNANAPPALEGIVTEPCEHYELDDVLLDHDHEDD